MFMIPWSIYDMKIKLQIKLQDHLFEQTQTQLIEIYPKKMLRDSTNNKFKVQIECAIKCTIFAIFHKFLNLPTSYQSHSPVQCIKCHIESFLHANNRNHGDILCYV